MKILLLLHYCEYHSNLSSRYEEGHSVIQMFFLDNVIPSLRKPRDMHFCPFFSHAHIYTTVSATRKRRQPQADTSELRYADECVCRHACT